MIKTIIIKKLLLVVAGLWVIKEGHVVIDGSLKKLNHKLFHMIGRKYPRLRFLKDA